LSEDASKTVIDDVGIPEFLHYAGRLVLAFMTIGLHFGETAAVFGAFARAEKSDNNGPN
jgi:hypothetical protein